jgi:hypothetical protein
MPPREERDDPGPNPGPDPGRASCEELLSKYRRMRRMRLEDEATPGADQRGAMRALAADFPGALREIDERPLEQIEARIAALEGALEGGPLPPWTAPVAGYHRLLRAALRIRRAAPKSLPEEERRRAAREAGRALSPPVEGCWAEAPLTPPEGRLTALVIGTLEDRLGLSVEAIEEALFFPHSGKS